MSKWKEELVTEISYDELPLAIRKQIERGDTEINLFEATKENNVIDCSNVKENDVDINNLLPSIKNRMKNAEK